MKCAKLHMGYAGYRLERIERGEVKARRATRIALMKVEVFGIKSYKLGVTYRPLGSRYKENVRYVHFEAVMDELDALRMEQFLHTKYHSSLRDLRVFKAGMRQGKRWSGDSELYLAKAVPLILRDIKNMIAEIENSKGDYWSSVPKLMPPRLEIRRVDRPPGVHNQPRPVICLDTMKQYPSASSAAKEIGSSQGNLVMVCHGKRGNVKGLRFAYVDDYEAELSNSLKVKQETTIQSHVPLSASIPVKDSLQQVLRREQRIRIMVILSKYARGSADWLEVCDGHM